MDRRFALAGALALVLSPAIWFAQPIARADDAPKPAAPSADYFCPDCKAPIRYDQDKCPHCGAEFEPLKPRVKKGEAKPAESANESPFPAPPPDKPYEKAAPDIIDSPWPQIQPPAESRFGFGSYGRVGIILDPSLKGAQPVDIVDYAPRLHKQPYEELHFFYKDAVNGLPVLVKTTLAFDQQLYDYSAEFAHVAVRELYLEVAPEPWLAVWVGERMYRGDDMYILDFWPLDDQNTLGGGAAFRLSESQTLQAHVGFNRIKEGDDAIFFQFQEIEVTNPVTFGTQDEVFLDRNRGTASLTYKLELPWELKWKVHGEGTYLPPGQRRLENGDDEHLPADHGFLFGTEIEKKFGPTFGRLFVKYADGLSSFDELQIPYGFDSDLKVTDARRLLVGLGGALDTYYFGAHYGFYWQTFKDADGIDDHDDQDQYAFAVRPEAFLGEHFRLGLELSWEGLAPKERAGLSTSSESGSEFAQVTSLHFLAGIAAGRGPYARPALYIFYGFHWLNSDARDEVELRTSNRPDAREDVMGLLAEWWF